MSVYPPTCHGCSGRMQPMATNGYGSFVVMVCETCDGPTLETMWGAAADQAAIDAWVQAHRADSTGGRDANGGDQ